MKGEFGMKQKVLVIYEDMRDIIFIQIPSESPGTYTIRMA